MTLLYGTKSEGISRDRTTIAYEFILDYNAPSEQSLTHCTPNNHTLQTWH